MKNTDPANTRPRSNTARLALLTAALLIIAGCQPETSPAPAPEKSNESPAAATTDAAPDKLARVVTLGVAISEIVHDLDCGATVVAVDESCTTVPAYAGLPRVGYYRNFSAEGVLAQRPTLILASGHSGPPGAIEQLRASGVPLVIISEYGGIESVPRKIRDVSAVVGCPERAEMLVEQFQAHLNAAPLAVEPPRVLFLMSPPGVGNWLAAGAGSVAQEVIEAAGGRNAVEGFEGYKPLSREALAVMRPDLIVMPADALARAGGLEAVLDALGFPADSPARAAGVYEVDLAQFLSTGPRLGQSVSGLRARLAEMFQASSPADDVNAVDREQD